MPFPLIEAHAVEADAASAKVELARASMLRLLVQAVVGGVLLAAAVLLMLLVDAPLIVDGSGWATPVRGVVLGIGLAVSVVVGAELFPSTALTMVRGVIRHGVDIGDAAVVALTSLLGNLAGAVALAAAVDAIGIIPTGASVQQRALGALAVDLGGLGGGELFVRSVLCSIVLSIGLVLAAGTPAAPRRRLLVMWVAAAVAAVIGLNLSVVGAALLSLAALSDVAVWGEVSRQLAATVPGAVVGAALVVAATVRAGRRSVLGADLTGAAEVPVQRAPEKRAPEKRVPPRKVPTKAAPATKAPATKAPAKKAPAKKAPAKKAPAKKAPAKKVPARKASAKTAGARRAVAR